MSGYTPVFDSVFKGSLYGKWPDTAAWICLLALADWRGHVDVTPEAIAGMTGMPLKDLNDCIKRFCEPDPRSRSQEAEGRKLIPIDPNRDWGWIVVNIQKYREKARNQNQISDGRNAEKVRRYKERHRKTPEDTGGNRETPNSDSDSDSDKDIRPMSSSSTSVVFDHWKAEYGHPKAKLDAKRKRVISAALQNYSPDDLKRAISGYKNSPHHMGKNERATVYDDIEIFLRDAKHIDAGLKFAEKGSEVKWL